jgi:anti-sigma factor RsiW
MTCRELYGFLDEFLDGRLDETTRSDFEGHLDRCASCRKYLATYRATLKTAVESERADAPARDMAPEGLVQAILAARAGSNARGTSE